MERYEYTGFHGSRSWCDLQIINHSYYVLVVATEAKDNPGTSVTNFAEHLATQICRREKIAPARLVWVEHYLGGDTKLNPSEETWDLVSFDFDWENCSFCTPTWRRMARSTVESLRMGVASLASTAINEVLRRGGRTQEGRRRNGAGDR